MSDAQAPEPEPGPRPRRNYNRNKRKPRGRGGPTAGETAPTPKLPEPKAPDATARDDRPASRPPRVAADAPPAVAPRPAAVRADSAPGGRVQGPDPLAGAGSTPEAGGTGTSKGEGKSRKVRKKSKTRVCTHCYTPCATIYRVRLTRNGEPVYICDLCWGVRCDGNPEYSYLGLWVEGRMVEPGSRSGGKEPRSKAAKSGRPTPGGAKRPRRQRQSPGSKAKAASGSSRAAGPNPEPPSASEHPTLDTNA